MSGQPPPFPRAPRSFSAVAASLSHAAEDAELAAARDVSEREARLAELRTRNKALSRAYRRLRQQVRLWPRASKPATGHAMLVRMFCPGGTLQACLSPSLSTSGLGDTLGFLRLDAATTAHTHWHTKRSNCAASTLRSGTSATRTSAHSRQATAAAGRLSMTGSCLDT